MKHLESITLAIVHHSGRRLATAVLAAHAALLSFSLAASWLVQLSPWAIRTVLTMHAVRCACQLWQSASASSSTEPDTREF
jgi:hypothetical protein